MTGKLIPWQIPLASQMGLTNEMTKPRRPKGRGRSAMARKVKARRAFGRGPEISLLSDLIRTIRLVAFDFDGVFTDNAVYVFQDGSEAVRCCRGDGIGLEKLRALGVDVAIISTETNPVVSARARKLGIPCVQNCKDKRAALEDMARQKGIALAEVAFVGNDINDLPCLTAVALPVVVQDAHPDVIPYGRYRTTSPGGQGAVRELCDLFEGVLKAGAR